MSYTLYWSPGTASLAVHWMLIHIGAPFEMIKADIEKGETRTAEFLALNPRGHVPALTIDGALRGETAALLMLLAERHPEAKLDRPNGHARRADYVERMVYLTNTMMPAFRAWFVPREPASGTNEAEVKAAARARIENGWSWLDRSFGAKTYMIDDELSAADFLATLLMRWSRNMPHPIETWPNLAAYSKRMRALPSLREVHAREGLTDWIGA